MIVLEHMWLKTAIKPKMQTQHFLQKVTKTGKMQLLILRNTNRVKLTTMQSMSIHKKQALWMPSSLGLGRKKQMDARHCLDKTPGALHYLARQGIAIRGHVANKGNLPQLLKFLGNDDNVLTNWSEMAS